MGRPVVEVFGSAREAAREAADAIAAGLRDAVLERGRATFIATGGKTPETTYDVLARADAPWGKITVTLTDERWVDPHGPDSNQRMVLDRLFTERAAAATFVPLKSAHATPQDAVADAENQLRPILPADVVLLGMGEDGHVASLFPGGPVEAEGLAVAAQGVQPRLSLTLAALEPRRLTVLLISGQAKRRTLEDRSDLPVHILLARTKAPVRVLWWA